MKTIYVTLMVLCLSSLTVANAQTSFNVDNAKALLNSLTRKLGFEGIYEIYYRQGSKRDDITDKNNSYDNIKSENFKTENIKVCVYSNGERAYFKLINDNLSATSNEYFYNFSFAEPTSTYSVDSFGILTNIMHYEAKNVWMNEEQRFISRIYNQDNTLSYDVKVYGLRGVRPNEVLAIRTQFLLKKLF